jgi:hypothetical protein
MALSEHEVEIAVGRRAGDGQVRVSVFARELLALTVEGTSERAPTFLLTLEQARSLQRALDELIPIVKEAALEPQPVAEALAWQGEERRK